MCEKSQAGSTETSQRNKNLKIKEAANTCFPRLRHAMYSTANQKSRKVTQAYKKKLKPKGEKKNQPVLRLCE